MKRLLFLIALFSISACSDYNNQTNLSIKDKTETINISIQLIQQNLTKGTVPINSNIVKSSSIYIVNELGDVTNYYSGTETTTIKNLSIYKDMLYKVYVFVNINPGALKNINDIENYSYNLNSIDDISINGGIIMSGKTEFIKLSNKAEIPISVTRCIAQLKLVCNYSQLNPDVRIAIKRVELKNAASIIKPFKEHQTVDKKTIQGECYTNIDNSSMSKGLLFLLPENVWGTVAPRATNNKEKADLMSLAAKENCSYIEMEYEYLSQTKKGSMIYRFYIGRTHEDCEIIRNNIYNCEVFFKEDGSVNENSWSVDNSGIVDLVTSIDIQPKDVYFTSIGSTQLLRYRILPNSASNKKILWESSNNNIATVNNGIIRSTGWGSCYVTATSTDGGNVSGRCNITVDYPGIAFTYKSKIMYDGEIISIPYFKLFPKNSVPVISEYDPNIIEVLESNNKGIKIKAKSIGNTSIKASINGYSTVCTISVEELRLIFEQNIAAAFFYEGFKDTIKYTILPEHASNLSIIVSYTDDRFVKQIKDNIFFGNKASSEPTFIKFYFKDFPNKIYTKYAIVQEALNVESEISLLANASQTKKYNLKHKDISAIHKIWRNTHPSAKIIWESNTPGLNITNMGEAYVSEPTTLNGINGEYKITATITSENNTQYKSTVKVNIYEEVNICVLYEEYESYNQNGEVGILISETPFSNKPVADVYFKTNHEYTSMNKKEIWEEGFRTKYYNKEPVVIIKSKSTTKNRNGKYCYYISYVSQEMKDIDVW